MENAKKIYIIISIICVLSIVLGAYAQFFGKRDSKTSDIPTNNTTDENVIKEKYQRLVEIYKSDIPYISLYNNKYTVAYNSELVGDLTPNWFNAFYGIESWYK